MEVLLNLTDLDSLVSSACLLSQSFAFPKLNKLRLLLCLESHLSLVASLCPNVEYLALRFESAEAKAYSLMIQLESIGQFSNLVVLDLFCFLGDVSLPPFSQLVNLRELVFSTIHPFSRIWCSLFAVEMSKSLRFLSLSLWSSEGAEALLHHLQLTVLKVATDTAAFVEFKRIFHVPMGNPKYMFVNAGDCYLLNGEVSSTEPFNFGKRYLSYG